MAIATDESLTPQQLEALTLLFLGGEMQSVAEKIGIERQTLLRWKKTPQWQEEWTIRLNDRIDRGRHRNVLGGDIGQTRLERLASGIGDPLLDEAGKQKRWPDGRLRFEPVPYPVQVSAAQTLVKLADLEPAQRVESTVTTTTPDVAAMQARLAAIEAERAELLAAGDEG